MIEKRKNIIKSLKALSDPVRLEIISHLKKGNHCVCEIISKLKMSQPRISRHLSILKEAGLIKRTKRGKWCYYNITNQQKWKEIRTELHFNIPKTRLSCNTCKGAKS